MEDAKKQKSEETPSLFNYSEDLTVSGRPIYNEGGNIDSAQFEDFDKVSAKKGLTIYRDMKYDEQIKFCLTIKKYLLLSAEKKVISSGDTPSHKEQAEYVRKALFETMNRPLLKVIWDMLSAFEYGFSVSELLWKREESSVKLIDIKTKLPWDVDYEYDEYGNLKTLKIVNEEMAIHKFAIYSFGEQFGNKRGESDLKAAYNAWWFKNNIWKFWARHLERFGSPIVKGHVPAGATQKETDEFYALINKLHHIVGVLLPRGKTGEEYDFDLVEARREGGGQFINAIENSDNRIARAMVIPYLFGSVKTSFGSYALGEKQFQAVYKVLSIIAEDFAESVINSQIIRRIIDYNFAEKLYPKFVFGEIDKELLNAALKSVDSKTKEKETTEEDETME